jgi:hypothetical protein
MDPAPIPTAAPTPDPPTVSYDPARPLVSWVLAGCARGTVTSQRTGHWLVLKVVRTRVHLTARCWSYFVYVRGGDDDPDQRTPPSSLTKHGWRYVGELAPDSGLVSKTARSEYLDPPQWAAVLWVFRRIWAGWDGTPTAETPATLRKSVQCARCRRPLTDPESLALGLGRACWEKTGGGV